MGDDVDPDRDRRWRVGLVYGALWVTIGWLTPVILPAMLALPTAVVVSVAGLALIPALTGAITVAMADEPRRFAAILTFAVTASGVAAFGIGAAFWGLGAGLLALALDGVKARLIR
jgi:benzoate membrane transport protein